VRGGGSGAAPSQKFIKEIRKIQGDSEISLEKNPVIDDDEKKS
jgi:hypothetical protein